MGFGGISIWQLLIILAIVVLVFGTKRLKNMGSDLGGAIKGFKKAVSDEPSESSDPKQVTTKETSDATNHSKSSASEKQP